ncbi:MAG: hypothetical protein A2202_02545 [Bdellovibrionales bacterium RIFOXYA1_FULL_36_14]|nr:MAG: hypothetical protein A2202_02545 [Bdellovibrionales bacterium RIFOXYA1_FULL_36_14]
MIKFKFLFLYLCMLGGFSNFACGESSCETYLKDVAGDIPHYGDFWSIKGDGSFNLDKTAMAEYGRASYKKDDESGDILIGENPIMNSKKFVKITLDANKRVSKMEIRLGSIGDYDLENELKVITLGYKGEECYPLSKERMSKQKPFTDFNTDACRELINYLEKNKEAMDCKCGTDQTNQALQKILDIHHILSPPWFKMLDKKPLNAMESKNGWLINNHEQLSKPLWRALMLREDCLRTPGVKAALDNKDLWKVKSADVDKKPSNGNDVKKGI